MADVLGAASAAGPVGSNISDYTSLVPGSKGVPSTMQNIASQANDFSSTYKDIAGGLTPQQPMQFNPLTPMRPQVQLQQQDLLSGVRGMGGNK